MDTEWIPSVYSLYTNWIQTVYTHVTNVSRQNHGIATWFEIKIAAFGSFRFERS